MTMLPDVDEQTYTAYQQEDFDRRAKERLDKFSFMQSAGDRLSQLQSAVGGFAGAAGEAVGGAAAATGEAVGGAASAAGQAVGGAAEAAGTAVAPVAAATGEAVGGAAQAGGDALAQQQAQLQAAMAQGAPSAAAPEPFGTAPSASSSITPIGRAPLVEPGVGLEPIGRAPLGEAGPQMDLMQQQLQEAISAGTQNIQQAPQAAASQMQQLQDVIGQGFERVQQAPGAIGRGIDTAIGGPVNPNPTPDEVRSYIAQAAQARGIDPDIALRVAQSEGGMEAARRGTFKTGSSWWPFQLHYGGKGYEQLGNVAGMGNSFTAKTGFEPGDPNAWQAATDYALDAAKQGGWGAWYGAKAQGITGFQGIDRNAPNKPFVHQAADKIGGAANALLGGGTAGNVSQFGDPQLSAVEANAACGPAAAVRFAQRFGRNPTLREAVDLAASVGWTAGQGMAGIVSQQALMKKMGVDTELVEGAQWDRFAKEAQTGNPVTISTSAHYFYADGYNPETGAFHVGKSGTDLRGGAEWMTKDEIVAAAARLGGGNVQGALLANNPTVPAESTATSKQSPWQAVQGAVSGAAQAVGQTGETLLQQLTRSSEEATVKGRAYLADQQAKLDAAVVHANASNQAPLAGVGQGLAQTTEAAGQGIEGRLGQVVPSSYEDFTRRIETPEDSFPGRAGLGTAFSALGTGAKLAGDVANELSPLTAAGRVHAGEDQLLWADPQYRAVMDAMGITRDMNPGQQAQLFASMPESMRQEAQARVQDVRSRGPVTSSEAAWEPGAEREEKELAYNLMGAAASLGLAPQGLASGLPRFAASLAVDPATAPFGVAAEGIGAAARAAGRLGSLAPNTTSAGIIADAAPQAKTIFQRLQEMPMLTADDAAVALGSPQLPNYLEGVVAHMTGQREKLLSGQVTPREVAKAWLLTLSSIQNPERAEATVASRLGGEGGMFPEIPERVISTVEGQRVIRPEDMTAEWMLTPQGRAALDAFETGQPTEEALAALENFRSTGPWPMVQMTRDALTGQKQGGEVVARNWFEAIPRVTEAINEAGRTGNMEALDQAVQGLRGVGANKTAFVKQLLGLGNGVTVDSNEINWWLTGIPNAKNIADEGVRESVKAFSRADPKSGVPQYLQAQLSERFGELRKMGYGADIPEDAFNSVMHHWLWDTVKNARTTHESMYEAMNKALIPQRQRRPEPSALGLPSLGPLQGAIGGGVGGGMHEAQQPGATPESVLRGAIGGAALGAGRSALARGGVRTGRLAAIGERVGGAADEAAEEAPAAARPGYGLNIDKLKYFPEEVQQILQDTYDKSPEVMDAARRGVLPDDVVKDMAAQVDPKKLNAMLNFWKPGQARNAESIYAMRQALADSGNAVIEAQRFLRESPESTNAQLAMIQALTKHGAIQEAVTGVTAESGRALRQFRQGVEGSNAMLDRLLKMAKAKGMTAEELTGELSRVDLTDSKTLNDLVQKLNPATKWDKAMALWYFNLLSSPTTHLRNVIGNTVGAVSAIPEAAGAAAFDPLARAAIRAMGGEGAQRERYLGEAAADIVGLKAGMGTGIRTALKRLTEGPTAEDILTERAHPEVWAQGKEGIERILGVGIHSPGRALAAEDAFFSALNESAGGHRMAYRQAMQEGKRTPTEVTERMMEILKNPDEAFLKQLQQEGKYRTFQNDTAVSAELMRLRKKFPVARALMPFVRTPVNMMQYSMERSPLGYMGIARDLASKGGREGLVKRGGGDLADRLSRATLGTAVFGGLAAFGGDNLTGRAPMDPAERDAFFRQGKQPYSFRNPIDGKWTSYQPLQPYTPLIAAAANMNEALRDPKSSKDVASLAALAAITAGQSMFDMPWTQGLMDAMDVISGQGPGGRDPQKQMNDFLERQAAGLVPGAAGMRTLARAMDNTIRDPDNPLEAMMAGIPGLQGMVDPKLNAFGEPQRRPTSGLGVLNPFNPSEPTHDMVEKELERLQLDDWDVQPGFVGKNVTIAGQPVELRDEQHQQYQRQAGQLTYAMLQLLVGSDEWAAASDADKVKAVETVTERVRKAVRTEMTPELWDQAIDSLLEEQQKHPPTQSAAPTATAVPAEAGPPPIERGATRESNVSVERGGTTVEGSRTIERSVPIERSR